MLAFPQTPSRRHRQHPSQQVYTLPSDNNIISHKLSDSLPSAYTTAAIFSPSTDLQPILDSGLSSDFRLTSRPETLNLDDALNSSPLPELMQSDAWVLGNQFTPSSIGRFSHHRESSLSSLGSAGPASPYAHPTSNPHIAVTDSAGDALHDLEAHDAPLFYQQFPKAAPASNDGISPASFPTFHVDHHAEMRYPAPVQMQRPKTERSLLPPAELSVSTSRSHPNSVASSVAGDSPATPLLGEPEAEDRRRKAAFSVPKLDRTMTDIYSDELYSPNFAITSASPVRQTPDAGVSANDVFAQRLQAANSQHLSAAHSPASDGSRDRSPFRQGSPLAFAPSHDFSSQPRLGSAARTREQGKAAQVVRLAHQQQQLQQEARQQPPFRNAPPTPQTISPKDAILEFHETDNDANYSLFPQMEAARLQHFGSSAASVSGGAASSVTGLPGSMGGAISTDVESFSNYPGQTASLVQVPQHYPFISRPRSNLSSPPRFESSESGSGQSTPPGLKTKPVGATADAGTYTCTYHGCTLRFETPGLLQKHKREGHRQGQGLAVPRKFEDGVTSALLNSQAGPHRCDRINPSTGKPCGRIFSRPYDLTRHEDTIHNARKQKVRCDLCTEDKTFSRADALTRHYRVCHPDIEFPGKHRRRVSSGLGGE